MKRLKHKAKRRAKMLRAQWRGLRCYPTMPPLSRALVAYYFARVSA